MEGRVQDLDQKSSEGRRQHGTGSSGTHSARGTWTPPGLQGLGGQHAGQLEALKTRVEGG